MAKYWLPDPEMQDFPAAIDYLELLFPLTEAKQYVAKLQKAETIQKKAKDILRAAQ
jgi:hypothetical protein